MTKIASRAVATVAVILMAVGAATPAQAGERNLDVNGYCINTYAGSLGKATTVSRDAYGWRCQLKDTGGGSHNVGIDMNAVCHWQYSIRSKAYLLNNDSSSLLNWRCS